MDLLAMQLCVRYDLSLGFLSHNNPLLQACCLSETNCSASDCR
jgi:hypothetical protein